MPLMGCAQPKPIKGSGWLAIRQRKAKQKATENAIMAAVKGRDGRTCRFPKCEHMPKKPRLETAHMEHRGLGGNPKGDRTQSHKLITFCFIHHGLFDRGLIEVDAVTAKGTDGPCAFYEKHPETGRFIHVASEPRR